ncbi:MAG: hypothetical protein NTX05_08100 [Fusobacteria bacterium]|nr:hypothetical protein [Fusobacteriota bacterium]
MYNIIKKKYSLINSIPWEMSFEERLNFLMKFSKQYKLMVHIYEKADTSTFRYRCYNIYQLLLKSETWRSIYFFDNEVNKILAYLDIIDVVTIVRARFSLNILELIGRVKAKKIPLVFDVDDLVFDLKKLPLLTNTLNVRLKNHVEYDFWFAYIGRISLVGEYADYCTTTNEFLAERLMKKYNKPTHIIPNGLNHEQIQISQECLSYKKNDKTNQNFCIGYFSGTPSHINDFLSVSDEIEMLLNEFENITLKIVGFMEIPEKLLYLVKSKKIIQEPLQNFIDLQKKIAEVDVNIVPLVNNEFTNCKSELKYFEAAIVHTITCASPTYMFVNNITQSETGFICKPGEWYETIKKIYSLSFSERKEIAENSYQYCLKKYSGSDVIKNIEKVYDEIVMEGNEE